MKTQKIIFIIAVLELVLIVGFFIYLGDDPRMVDGELDLSEASILESVFLIQAPIVIVIAWVFSLFKAVVYNRLKWFFGILFIWPLFFLFLAKIKEKNEDPSIEPAGPKLLSIFLIFMSLASLLRLLTFDYERDSISSAILLLISLSTIGIFVGLKKKANWTMRPAIVWFIGIIVLMCWSQYTVFGLSWWVFGMSLVLFGGFYLSILLYTKSLVAKFC